MTKDPCGSIATKQALRMLGESAADIPHIRHMSFSLLLMDCKFRRLSKQLQSEQETTDVGCIAKPFNVQEQNKNPDRCKQPFLVFQAGGKGPFHYSILQGLSTLGVGYEVGKVNKEVTILLKLF